MLAKLKSLISLGILILVALLVRATIFQISLVPTGSMIPNLNIGDKTYVNKLYLGIQNPLYNASLKKKILFLIPNPLYNSSFILSKIKYIKRFKRQPKRFEVVVFFPPEKSVLGKVYYYQGDKNNSPIVFGKPGLIGESYVKRLIGLPGETIEIKKGDIYINGAKLEEKQQRNKDYFDFGPLEIPEGTYFMIGDNRPRSADSRVWGVLPKENILGNAVFIFWPFSAMKEL